jgi:hypothetical protein
MIKPLIRHNGRISISDKRGVLVESKRYKSKRDRQNIIENWHSKYPKLKFYINILPDVQD